MSFFIPILSFDVSCLSDIPEMLEIRRWMAIEGQKRLPELDRLPIARGGGGEGERHKNIQISREYMRGPHLHKPRTRHQTRPEIMCSN